MQGKDIFLLGQLTPPNPVRFLFLKNEACRSIYASSGVEMAYSPQEYGCVPLFATEIDPFIHQAPAYTEPPDLRMKNEPAKLGAVLRALHDRH